MSDDTLQHRIEALTDVAETLAGDLEAARVTAQAIHDDLDVDPSAEGVEETVDVSQKRLRAVTQRLAQLATQMEEKVDAL